MLLGWLEDLARAGRALSLVHSDGATLWLAAEHARLVSAAYPDAAAGREGQPAAPGHRRRR